jgi:orotate phosphoribosyltransferase
MAVEEILDLFRRHGALLEGHFRLSSGLHSSGYLQAALVLQYPEHAAALGAALATRLSDLRPSCVLSPALGGIVIGHEVARALGTRAMFVERHDGHLTLRRGFTIGDAERLVVVEDVLTTGGSSRETIQVAQASGAQVVGAAAVIDRSGGAVDLGVPLFALADVTLPTYEPDHCPLCREGQPLVKPGSR